MRRPAIFLTALTACVALAMAEAVGEQYQQFGDGAQSADLDLLNRSSDGTRELRRSEGKAYDIEVWDTQAKKTLGAITGLSGVVNAANISPDGTKVVTAERRGIVGLWDAATGKQIRLLRGHRRTEIHDARFSPDGKVIASAARDGTARTWDAETGAQIAEHKQSGGSYVDAVCVQPRWADGYCRRATGGSISGTRRTGDVHSSTRIGPEDEGLHDGCPLQPGRQNYCRHGRR